VAGVALVAPPQCKRRCACSITCVALKWLLSSDLADILWQGTAGNSPQQSCHRRRPTLVGCVSCKGRRYGYGHLYVKWWRSWPVATGGGLATTLACSSGGAWWLLGGLVLGGCMTSSALSACKGFPGAVHNSPLGMWRIWRHAADCSASKGHGGPDLVACSRLLGKHLVDLQAWPWRACLGQ
jgi:hypothetical protein